MSFMARSLAYTPSQFPFFPVGRVGLRIHLKKWWIDQKLCECDMRARVQFLIQIVYLATSSVANMVDFIHLFVRVQNKQQG